MEVEVENLIINSMISLVYKPSLDRGFLIFWGFFLIGAAIGIFYYILRAVFGKRREKNEV